MGKVVSFVDYWRWIFCDYKEKGYVIMFFEDLLWYVVFNYCLKGFCDFFIDYYFWLFWIVVEDFWYNYCINSWVFYNVFFEYILRYFCEYKLILKFMFVLYDEILYDDFNIIVYVDDDFKNFLWCLKEELFFNEMFFIIFSDYGVCFFEVRKMI